MKRATVSNITIRRKKKLKQRNRIQSRCMGPCISPQYTNFQCRKFLSSETIHVTAIHLYMPVNPEASIDGVSHEYRDSLFIAVPYTNYILNITGESTNTS